MSVVGMCGCTCRASENVDPETTLVSVYFCVGDADALYDQWSRSVVEGRFVAPCDTEYGLRAGAYIDSDANLLRFGSWLG
jgi:hypothetical protein